MALAEASSVGGFPSASWPGHRVRVFWMPWPRGAARSTVEGRRRELPVQRRAPFIFIPRTAAQMPREMAQ